MSLITNLYYSRDLPGEFLCEPLKKIHLLLYGLPEIPLINGYLLGTAVLTIATAYTGKWTKLAIVLACSQNRDLIKIANKIVCFFVKASCYGTGGAFAVLGLFVKLVGIIPLIAHNERQKTRLTLVKRADWRVDDELETKIIYSGSPDRAAYESVVDGLTDQFRKIYGLRIVRQGGKIQLEAQLKRREITIF